jgi:hypothetical protein
MKGVAARRESGMSDFLGHEMQPQVAANPLRLLPWHPAFASKAAQHETSGRPPRIASWQQSISAIRPGFIDTPRSRARFVVGQKSAVGVKAFLKRISVFGIGMFAPIPPWLGRSRHGLMPKVIHNVGYSLFSLTRAPAAGEVPRRPGTIFVATAFIGGIT